MKEVGITALQALEASARRQAKVAQAAAANRRLMRERLEQRVAKGVATEQERDHLWRIQQGQLRREREAVEAQRQAARAELLRRQRTDLPGVIRQQIQDEWREHKYGFRALRRGGHQVVSLDAALTEDGDVNLHSLLTTGIACPYLVEWSDPTGECATELAS